MDRDDRRSASYDDFAADLLDVARWSYLTLPHVDGGSWVCKEESVRTEVGEGTLDMHLEQFEQTHASVQVLDNLKHQLVSTRTFALRDDVVAFGVDMAATLIGSSPTDYREGFANFMLLDPESGWSFRVCSTGLRVFGLYDSLRSLYKMHSSVGVIDPPIEPARHIGESRHHDLVVDPRGSTLEWLVDGRSAIRLANVELPASVSIGLGVATMKTLDPAPAGLLRAPGLSVSFGPVTVDPRGAARTSGPLLSASA